MADTNKRLQKIAEMREHLERQSPGSLFRSGQAAVYLGISDTTLKRLRVKGLGPVVVEPPLPPGIKRTTQPLQYRKSDLDVYISGRLGGGLMAFAERVDPWQLDAEGRIVGNALDLLDVEQLLEQDLVGLTLLEALQAPWVSAGAMQPYRDELVSSMAQMQAQVDSALLTLQFEESTPPATERSRKPSGL